MADVLEAEKPRIDEAKLPRINTATQKNKRHFRSAPRMTGTCKFLDKRCGNTLAVTYDCWKIP